MNKISQTNKCRRAEKSPGRDLIQARDNPRVKPAEPDFRWLRAMGVIPAVDDSNHLNFYWMNNYGLL